MSTTLRPHTMQQRAIQATRNLQEMLGLSDTRLLSTAIAEVAVEEARRNPTFAQQVRDNYAELEKLRAIRSRASRRSPNLDKGLVPIRTLPDARYDPHAGLDPYLLQYVYGDAQLRLALDGYSLIRLKEAATIVEEKNPGTKPASRARKDALVDYIVRYVAGPGY